MNFAEKIEALRSKAQETQAANKIIDMLKDIESKNNNTTAYRWIWELIQNAKDVANSSETVDILIEFDEKEKFIKFKHNGRLFTTKNIIFLIEQVSTKERGKAEGNLKTTTGKFGTGFLTTHLLSKKVNVSGYLQDGVDIPYSFNIDIDRSSDEQLAIIRSIEASCSQLDKNSVEITQPINENEYNTCFTYHLDSNGLNVAKKGLNNLVVSTPYVFAFVSEINSIEISANLINGKYHRIIKRVKTIKSSRLENAEVMCIDVNTNGNPEQRYIFTLTDCQDVNVALAIEIGFNGKEKFIKPINSDLPKLFCDFPLLGTHDFSFPVVINSASFNPTEPRDGVYLTHREANGDEDASDHKESIDIKENKNIMTKAVELYSTLLEHILLDDYKGVYNITKIAEPPIKEWLSEAWINNNITNELKSFIEQIELIDTHSGIKKPLKDEWTDEACVLIPNYTDVNIRNTLWNLSSNLIPDMITKQNEIGLWYESLWDDCRNYSVENLIEKVALFQNLSALESQLCSDVIPWLKQFYTLIYSREYQFAKSLNQEPQIIPNQNGDFCTINMLYIDCNIEEKYKDIALILGIDLKSMLIDKSFDFISNQIFVKKYKFEDMILDIQKALRIENINIDDFYKNILCLKFKEIEKQDIFLNLMNCIYKKESWEYYKVTNFSIEIFEKALLFWIETVCKDISSCVSILTFTNNYGFTDILGATKWLVEFTNYLTKFDMLSIFDRYSLLPNQNGEFKKVSELNLDSGEIDDIIKDVCKIIGFDIRENLLIKDIYYKMPKSRTVTNENVAGRITDYIEMHKNKLGESSEEKIIFRNFYLYLSENRLAKHIETAFGKLCANLNWLYNDEDIAENMRIIEEYNDILSKYGVSSVNQLESILSSLNSREQNVEKIEISQELLAQWGITTEEGLKKALESGILGENFIHRAGTYSDSFSYVQKILERSKVNVMSFLNGHEDYDLTDISEIAPTIYVVKKLGQEIYLMIRPSDCEQIILYYESEFDLLDYTMDWELWVEDGESEPQKITFGKILKLTGVNKIPLRKVR